MNLIAKRCLSGAKWWFLIQLNPNYLIDCFEYCKKFVYRISIFRTIGRSGPGSDRTTILEPMDGFVLDNCV